MPNDGPPVPVPRTNMVLINSTGSFLTPASPYYGVYGTPNAVSALPGGPLTQFLGVASLPNSASGDVPLTARPSNSRLRRRALEALEFLLLPVRFAEAPNNGFDETGYVLNGTFHVLADTNTPGQSILNPSIGFFVFGCPFSQAAYRRPGNKYPRICGLQYGQHLVTDGPLPRQYYCHSTVQHCYRADAKSGVGRDLH